MGDRERWDTRHRAGEQDAGSEVVDSFVAEALEVLGPGRGRRAVDLACGTGRHALELAARGWITSAWDLSPAALEIVSARAGRAGLHVAGREIDLAGGRLSLDGETFDLALIVNFLDRDLLRSAHGMVSPGGHLVFATFTKDRPGDSPRLEWCLDTGELEGGIEGFQMLLRREGEGRAAILGRRIAVDGRLGATR